MYNKYMEIHIVYSRSVMEVYRNQPNIICYEYNEIIRADMEVQ